MNPRRVATLLRELADALEEDEPANDREQPAKPLPRERSFPAPLREVSDTDKMRARKMLRRRGIG